MKKQMISIMLVLSITSSLLAGCSGQSAAQGSSGQAETSSDTEAEKAEESAETTAAGEADAATADADAAGEADAAAADADAQAEPADAAAAATAAGAEETAAAADAVDFTTGTPWICSFADGAVTADTATNLKDDFYLAVNKDEILGLQIPEGYSFAGTVPDVIIKNNEDIKNLFTSGKQSDDHDAQLALNLYTLYMDWDSRNAAGITPLKNRVDVVEAIDSMDGLLTYLKETPSRDVLCYPYSTGTMTSLEDSSKYILWIDSQDLLLEDSAQYTNLTDFGRSRKEALRTLATKLLVKMGYSEEEAAAKYENCLAFETALAPSIMTNQEGYQADYYTRINNHYTRDQVIEAQGKLPILNKIEDIDGYPQIDDFLMCQPEWLAKLCELFTEENLTMIKDYIIVRGSIGSAASLDRECYEWTNDCNNEINGSSGILPDETVFAQSVNSTLAWPVSKLYVESYLKQEDKDRLKELVAEAIDQYHSIINEADFLSDETKAAAIEKLDTMGTNVLWPDDWSPYSYEGLEIASAADGGTLWQALDDIRDFEIAKKVKEYSEPVNKSIWPGTPTTVNCFYQASKNSIYILGAFTQGDVYNSEMSDEEMYATIGAVIGHEISHAFDSTGAQFDKDGNMASWWTEEDYAAFNKKNKKLEEYFNAIQPWEGEHCKGSMVTGEACADMGGVKCMLGIASGKENFDYDKFFRGFAHLWMNKSSYGRVLRLLNNSHPMDYLRVNTVLQQYDEFLDCYDIKEGDGMYLAPEDRVNIW